MNNYILPLTHDNICVWITHIFTNIVSGILHITLVFLAGVYLFCRVYLPHIEGWPIKTIVLNKSTV